MTKYRTVKNPVKRPLDPSKCGRVSNWHAHKRRGQEPCEACEAAYRAYWREYAQNRASRKDTCLHGHPFTWRDRSGRRRCDGCYPGFDRSLCGTLRGYSSHRHHKVPLCQDCRDAHNRARSERRKLTRRACPKGHEYTEENTTYYADGRRRCRTCAGMPLAGSTVSDESMESFLKKFWPEEYEDDVAEVA